MTNSETSVQIPTTSDPAIAEAPRVLLITYTFPPVGGAGVQRVAKFAKFLPQCGWNVSVLTADNPSVPLFDESLLGDLPSNTVICRAKTWEPGYALKVKLASRGTSEPGAAGLKPARWSPTKWIKAGLRRLASFVLQPDPQILWKRNAVNSGLRLLAEMRHEVILVSGPPFSAFLIGHELSRRTGLPLVVDYRDEWDLSNRYWESKQLDRLSCTIQKRMQRSVLRSAAAVIATTQASTFALREACRRVGSRAQVECVYNGFDPDDFSSTITSTQPVQSDGIVRVVYLGTLWALTTIAPLVRAMTLLSQTEPETAAKIRLVVVGRRMPAEMQLLGQLRQLQLQVEEHDYVDHSEAVAIMSSADQLCVTLADVPGAERVLPAKVFEYLAARRPILAIAPRGELWDILQRFSESSAFEPTDVSGIAAYLRSLVASISKLTNLEIRPRAAQEFERLSQTRRLAEILAGSLSRPLTDAFVGSN